MNQRIIDYQRKYASKYIPAEGYRLFEVLPQCDVYHYSEKLDGILLFADNDGKEISFYNKSGNEIKLPALNAAFPKDAMGLWAGELYKSESNRSRPFLVSSSISNSNSDLAFAVFDCVNDVRKTIEERYLDISKFFPENGIVHKINLKKTDSRTQVINEYNSLVSNGSEGMVIHTPQGFTYKAKPQLSIDCIVLGYAMRENVDQIRELLIGIAVEDGYMVIGKVGSGFSESEREEWARTLKPKIINSAIVEIAGNGLAFYWVKPEFVIEVKCLELLIENSDGAISKQKVSLNNEKGYTQAGMITGVSLMSPVYREIRLDKKADIINAGLDQITSRVEIVVNNSSIKESQTSKLLKREIYIKEGKNGRALRKFVSWKTNKEETGSFPSYILYYTDFSSGRKEPLQTEIYTAVDQEELKIKFNNLIEENIKKGWIKI
jgi:hypothetical protein